MPTESAIEKAFRNGVANITDEVVIARLLEALRDGRVDDVIAVLDIEPAAFDELRGLLVAQYAESGAEEAGAMKFRQPVRWNSASPAVEAYARNEVGTRIKYITNDMIDAVRGTVADGYAYGRSVNRMALDLVGRVGANGRRQGGIVGLNLQQSEWIANFRRALQTDPASALRFGLRDKRFDKTLASGTPLTANQIDRMTRQYANKLLLSRGKMIARTERGKAINQGRMEAWRQAANKFGFPLSEIRKEWIYTARSREPRPYHRALGGTVVQGLETPFSVGGVLMQCPHDVGAPAEEVINCMCECRFFVPKGVGNG